MSKVFGIGLSRTGTTSLNAAFGILGFKSIHCPADAVTFQELIRGKFRLTILEGLDGITDETTVPYFRDLDREYPGSRFVMTIRDKEPWLESSEHILDSWLWGRMPSELPPNDKNRMLLFLMIAVYGTHCFAKDRFSTVYDAHVESVMRYFQERDNLLVMNIVGGDGWSKLCPFLGKPIPAVPFPWHNQRSPNDRGEDPFRREPGRLERALAGALRQVPGAHRAIQRLPYVRRLIQ